MELITVEITVKAVTFFENVLNSIIKPAPIHKPLAYNNRHDLSERYYHQKYSACLNRHKCGMTRKTAKSAQHKGKY